MKLFFQGHKSAAISVMALLLALALAACGVPLQSKPHAISEKALPFGLSSPAGPTHAKSNLGIPVVLYFVNQTTKHLVAVTTEVSYPASLKDALEALLQGPSKEQAKQGASTEVPSDLKIHSVTLDGTEAIVNLGKAFTDTVGPALIVSVAQIVWTLTGTPRVTSVTFEVDGTPVAVPVADGSLANAPVKRTDYASLAPLP
jgi:spore germination protein GerM